MAYTNSFAIANFGSAEITADIVDGGSKDGYVQGIQINGIPVDPSTLDWNTISQSSELSAIVNQYNGTINQAVKFVSDEQLDDLYYKQVTSFNNNAIIEKDENKQLVPIPSNQNYNLSSSVTKKTKSSTSTLAYPVDIDTTQDYLQINKFKYSAPSGGTGTRGSQYTGTVILPMPKVSDSNGTEWGESKLNVFQATAVGALGAGLRSAGITEGGIPESTKTPFDKAKGMAGSVIGGAAIGGAMGGATLISLLGNNISADELLARTTGNVANPNAELLFRGPDLRQFTFSYILVARNKDEGANIRRIIKFFKDGVAPKKLNNALLGTPDIFGLEYKTKNNNKSVNKFKDMALRRITTDSAPDGMWVAYEDSQPVAVRIQLEFTELQPIYDEDQNKYSGDDVGY
jgi:hypothetical protein